MAAAAVQLPDFDDLPPVDGQPQGCAWGIFDKDGEKDLLGTLNLLTPSVVAKAASEVRDGVSISLNWPLNGLKFPIPGRKKAEHKITTLQESGVSPGHGWDDELSFNTQISSQWDSLVHWEDQASRRAYNGIEVRHDHLGVPTTGANRMPTLDHWHGRGGLVARGVLIDYGAWREATAAGGGGGDESQSPPAGPYHPMDGHRITVAELEAVAAHQGVELRPGDVLVLRTGMTEVLEAPGPEDLARMQQERLSGLHGSPETARWLWNRRLAAVASDTWAVEAIPPVREDGSVGGHADLVLHHWLLCMFGMPMGELWDLKALSRHCKATGRYSFLLTSAPLNMPGLVGSPPNALAIF